MPADRSPSHLGARGACTAKHACRVSLGNKAERIAGVARPVMAFLGAEERRRPARSRAHIALKEASPDDARTVPRGVRAAGRPCHGKRCRGARRVSPA